MVNSISVMRPELVPEWSPRNLPLTPDNVSYGSNKLYWWKGSCGHEWQTSAKARSCGEKCPICSNARIIAGLNDLNTLEPDLAKEWSDKNLPLQPSMVGPGTHKKVIWRGSCGHEWTASVRSRVRGTGCPYCSHNIVLPGFNDLQTLHPEVAAEWSPKNLPLQPSQVTAYSNKKMWWRCDKGHEWYALISTRSYGSKCPYCSGILTFQDFNDFQTLHPELAAEWSERNGTLTPDKINDKSPKNVWWRCRACGYEWRAVVKARVKGLKCPVCADRAVLEGYNDLATTDKALLKEWPYELNADVEPTKITRNSLRPVWWRCKYGHTWKEKIAKRTIEGERCPVCEEEFARVLPQLLIMLYCGRLGFKVRLNDEETIGITLDAYIPELKLAVALIGNGTKAEEEAVLVIQHLCKVRGLLFDTVSFKDSAEGVCRGVKKAFQEAHIYITSDNDDDVRTAHRQFFRWKKC